MEKIGIMFFRPAKQVRKRAGRLMFGARFEGGANNLYPGTTEFRFRGPGIQYIESCFKRFPVPKGMKSTWRLGVRGLVDPGRGGLRIVTKLAGLIDGGAEQVFGCNRCC